MKSKVYDIIWKILDYVRTELVNNLNPEIKKNNQNEVMLFLIASIWNDLNCTSLLIREKYFSGSMLPMKRIIEAWRLQIIFLKYPDLEKKYITNKKTFKETFGKNKTYKTIGELVDTIIAEEKIYEIKEEGNNKFHQDIIRPFYEKFCAFSHLDYSELCIDVLDKNGKLVIGPHMNYDKHEKLIEFLSILIVLETQLINHLGWINTKSIEQECIELMEFINNNISNS